jgi:uncharacterized Zn finger protein
LTPLEVTIPVPSSSNSSVIYKVRVALEGDRLFVTCTCPAAKNGLLCKHRKSLIFGELKLKGQEHLLQQAQDIFAASRAAHTLKTLEDELAPLEAEYKDVLRKKGLLEERMNQLKHSYRHKIDSETPGAKKQDARWLTQDGE